MNAEPITIATGEQRPVTFASPLASWSLRVQGQDGFFDSEELHDLAAQLTTGQLRMFRLIITPEGDMGLEISSWLQAPGRRRLLGAVPLPSPILTISGPMAMG